MESPMQSRNTGAGLPNRGFNKERHCNAYCRVRAPCGRLKPLAHPPTKHQFVTRKAQTS